MQDTASNLQEYRDTKNPGCKLRKNEKSKLQYDLFQTEKPGYRIEETPRSLVALLPRGRRIFMFFFKAGCQAALKTRVRKSDSFVIVFQILGISGRPLVLILSIPKNLLDFCGFWDLPATKHFFVKPKSTPGPTSQGCFLLFKFRSCLRYHCKQKQSGKWIENIANKHTAHATTNRPGGCVYPKESRKQTANNNKTTMWAKPTPGV